MNDRRSLTAAARQERDSRLAALPTPYAWMLVIAVAYFVSGRLSQLLAIPPSYAAAVWPPAGIALAAMLLLGPRVWPGVFVGALLVNGWRPVMDAETAQASAIALITPSLISVAVTLQSLLGRWLIRRAIGFPNPLIHDRQILLFLALGGPVACLLGSTIGVTLLTLDGTMNERTSLALNWWTWWVGDVIGVIMFTPLLLIAFARPRRIWRPRWVSVGLPLTGALIATVLGIAITQYLDEMRARRQFERIAENSHQLLQAQINHHLDLIDSWQRLVTFSRLIHRDEFAEFNQDFFQSCGAARMIAWLSLERADDGTESLKADYLFPTQPSFLSLGDDFAANANWKSLMQQGCDLGYRVASEPFVTVGDHHEGDRHVLVLAPVYRRGTHPQVVSERRDSLRGFVCGVFEIDSLIRDSTPRRDVGLFELEIEDVTHGEAPKEVRRVVVDRSSSPQLNYVHPLSADFSVVSSLGFSGRRWNCRYTPAIDFYAAQANRIRWFILSSCLILSAFLGVFLLILSGRTARIEASKARYLDLYENAPDMFLSLNVGSHRIVECNRTFLLATGFAKETLIDKHMYDLFDASCHLELRRAFRTFLMTGSAADIELQLTCHDARRLDVSVKMSAAVDEDGKSRICRVALRDITARKQVEGELKAQERELAHAARLSMMGEMAAGLAHEINQPLGAIAAYAEGATIRLRDGKPDTDSLMRVLDRIAQDAHRGGQVIRRLRKFLQKRTPEQVNLRINDLVREVAQFVDADLRRREVTLGIDLAADLPPALGDPIQIQQVLLNLIRNGCDAMHDTELTRRSLMVRTRSIDGEQVDVCVEDCGHGLSHSDVDQLFNAFFSTKADGLGMGLAISRSIIEAHGGQIWAASNPEGGATFHFTLPASAAVCTSIGSAHESG